MVSIRTQSSHDQELLIGLLRSDTPSIKAIYDLVLPSVIHWLRENQGTEADARDIFQEGLIALFRRANAGDFELSCSLKSYLRIVCRNLWLSRLRQQKKWQAELPTDWEMVDLDDDIQYRIEQSEKESLFFRHFSALGDNCQKILQWFFDKMPLAKIAEQLDTSEGYIKKRKFQCKEKLVKAIKADRQFRELES